jgi:hypothetical protein
MATKRMTADILLSEILAELCRVPMGRGATHTIRLDDDELRTIIRALKLLCADTYRKRRAKLTGSRKPSSGPPPSDHPF